AQVKKDVTASVDVIKTHTVGEVWSGEHRDHGFTKYLKELDSFEDFVIVDKEYINRHLRSWVDQWECEKPAKEHEVIKEKSFRVIVKRKATKDKLRHEKIFMVDEALDGI
ncbi:hypothetical protein Tco_1389477, partial [Tanacetum coccineum]